MQLILQENTRTQILKIEDRPYVFEVKDDLVGQNNSVRFMSGGKPIIAFSQMNYFLQMNFIKHEDFNFSDRDTQKSYNPTNLEDYNLIKYAIETAWDILDGKNIEPQIRKLSLCSPGLVGLGNFNNAKEKDIQGMFDEIAAKRAAKQKPTT